MSPPGRMSRSARRAQASMTLLYLCALYSLPNRMLFFSVWFWIQACWGTYAMLLCEQKGHTASSKCSFQIPRAKNEHYTFRLWGTTAARAHTHTHMLSLTYRHMLTRSLSLSHTHTQALWHKHSLPLSLTHTHTHTHALSNMQTHTHSLSHTHTHTHALWCKHALSLSLSDLPLSLSHTHTHTHFNLSSTNTRKECITK